MDENVADVIVMKIKAKDKDLKHTANWEAVFEIIKGNEDGLFSIETDKETNEGVLKLIKVCSNIVNPLLVFVYEYYLTYRCLPVAHQLFSIAMSLTCLNCTGSGL